MTALIDSRRRDLELLTWYRFVRVMKKFMACMDETIQDASITRYQFDLLMAVAFDEGISQKLCAERLNVSKGNITQHIDRLEKKGFIRRQKEGWFNHLYLTDAGKDIVGEIMPVHDQRVREVMSVLTQDEVRLLQGLLRKFDRHLS